MITCVLQVCTAEYRNCHEQSKILLFEICTRMFELRTPMYVLMEEADYTARLTCAHIHMYVHNITTQVYIYMDTPPMTYLGLFSIVNTVKTHTFHG